jgi:hypothetical protein
VTRAIVRPKRLQDHERRSLCPGTLAHYDFWNGGNVDVAR